MNFEEAIGFAMTKTLRNMNVLFNHEFKQYGITSEQWILLKSLEEKDGISIKDLTHSVEKDQANVTRILDLLARKGLVKRCNNPNDKRSSLVFLTGEGSQLTKHLIPLDEKVQEFALEGLSEEELLQFKKLLSQINQNVRQYLDI
ncbi:MarR family winged helix-turn-helix transcriptional regulator [Paenibacillus sp. USHLN196]|uniref:MarR family winged helix-turn-helix transcriptional regulator n=1 Tax=Paenibacillus sp. USHLN196 TaxID=3081291 RepID=UPI003016FBD4